MNLDHPSAARALRGLLAGLAFALSSCATSPAPAGSDAAAPSEQREPVTILVSIDGFRPDYLDRGLTPNLNALAAEGTKAAMRPSFPSKTFPNHYTLVTGLRPDHHGIVDNNMEDPARPGVLFKISNSEAIDPFWWSAAEPIWTTAEKQGIRTGTMFWPGSEVPFGGVRPSNWMRYDENVSSRRRVATILDWLRRPAQTRPRFVTVYFDTVDTAGHQSGPGSAATATAIAQVDAEIGYMRRELAGMHQPANIVVVADHGMAATSPDRVVRIDRLLDAGAIHVVSDGPFMSLAAEPGHEAEVEAKLLGPHDHYQCWRKGDLPARFVYGRNRRVPAIFCLAANGWLLIARDPPQPFILGNHGYDNADPDMRALFIAAGPAIARAGRLGDFDNIDVYPLLARLVGIAPRPSDGDPRTLQPLFRR